jgi:photosystem II stability/assembly factor-like uncharacterized protein
MPTRKSLLTLAALCCCLAWLTNPLVNRPRLEGEAEDARRDVASERKIGNRKPLSIRERFEAERSAAGRGAALAEEAVEGEAGEAGERDAFEAWFFGQRTFPAGRLPVNAVGRARAQSNAKNKGAAGDPKWRALGPSTIPDGQTDATAGQLSPVSGRINAIATHPTNPDIAYAGGAQGGVWKTTNARSAFPTWTPLTDNEASLAVGAIAVDPVNPNIIYVGTGEANRSCDSYYGQGVLRSADGGATWTLLGGGGSPFNNPGPFVGYAISKILIDPSTAGSTTATTLWAATTIGVFSGGTIPTCATPSGVNVGLWRSIDSGRTWQLQATPAGFSIQDAALDPSNPNILYAAVRSTGVYKSENAKAASPTYRPMVTGFPIGTDVLGSALAPIRRINVGIGGPAAPHVLYASIENGAAGDRLWGMYKSVNGGDSWAHLDAGFNGNARFQNVDIDPDPKVTVNRALVTRLTGPAFVTDKSWDGRRLIMTVPTLNVRPLVSRTVLTVLDADHLLLTTTHGFGLAPGQTFIEAGYSVGSYPTYCDGQCFYDMTVAVDPTDPAAARVYVGGNPQRFAPNLAPNGGTGAHSNWRTDNGGTAWASISQGDGASASLHTDDHAYAFGADGSVFNGNDGGIWRSGDRGASWTSMNTNIAVTQFQGVALPGDGSIVLGGTQDNGTNVRNGELVDPPAWFHADFGDGGMAVIDQGTPSRMFHTYFNQAFNFMGPARSDVGGAGGPGSWPFVGAYYGYGPEYYNGMDPKDPVSFYAPLTQNPAFTPNVIYFGSNRLYRSPDPKPTLAKTPSWTRVSDALTKGGGAYLSWIGVFPGLVNGKEVIYTGASDGRISASATVDGTGVATWTTIDKAPLPNRAVSQVLADANDRTGNTVYATFSGFNGSTPTTPGHVFVSRNGLGAATWTNISGDLPDIPANAIAVDGTGAVYVGTDIGVFRTTDGGAHWTQLNNGLPNVAVFGLAMDRTGKLVAATHGRGMFELLKNSAPQKTK